jgi:hypothetical protein
MMWLPLLIVLALFFIGYAALRAYENRLLCPECNQMVPRSFVEEIEHGGIFKSQASTIACRYCLYADPYPKGLAKLRSQLGSNERREYK